MATSPVSSSPTAVFLHAIPPATCHATTYSEKENETDAATTASSSPVRMDPATREQVLLQHMSVVRFVARRIHERLPQHVELDDLVGAGIVGLIDAFNKFDHRKEVQFNSYAQFRIRGAILDSLRSLDWGSRDLRRHGRDIEEAKHRLTQRLSRRPTECEVAAELGMALGRYQRLLGNLKGLDIGSLNEMHSEDSFEEEVTYVPTSPEEDPLFLCMQGQMSARLTAAIAELPEREARVLALYYVEEMTLKEIGAILGLVESRVSQIRATAIVELRKRLTLPVRHLSFPSKTRLKAQQQTIPVCVMQRSAARAQRVGRLEMVTR